MEPHASNPQTATLPGLIPGLLTALFLAACLLAIVFGVGGEARKAAEKAQIDRSRNDRAQARRQLDDLGRDVENYRKRYGSFPKDEEWPRCVMDPSQRRRRRTPSIFDPWGNPIVYRKTGEETFEIVSLGADGEPGGTDDAADIRVSR